MVLVYCADSRYSFQVNCRLLPSIDLHGGEQIAFLGSVSSSAVSRLVDLHIVFHAKPLQPLLRTLPIVQLTNLLPYHNRNYSLGVPCNLHFRLLGLVLPLPYMGDLKSFV